jgi:hypothetical protein
MKCRPLNGFGQSLEPIWLGGTGWVGPPREEEKEAGRLDRLPGLVRIPNPQVVQASTTRKGATAMKAADLNRAWSERERRERLTARRACLAGSMAVAWGILTADELSVAAGGVDAPRSLTVDRNHGTDLP